MPRLPCAFGLFPLFYLPLARWRVSARTADASPEDLATSVTPEPLAGFFSPHDSTGLFRSFLLGCAAGDGLTRARRSSETLNNAAARSSPSSDGHPSRVL